MNLLKSAALAAFLLASVSPAAMAQSSSDGAGGEQGAATDGSEGNNGGDANGGQQGVDNPADTTTPAQACPEGQTPGTDGTCNAAQ